ncbi:MAG TPA: DUF6600 domain-containing protein [Candidatus Binatia bacterium]|nr:DUF6600 domain-containing protein [Candidatus Binatia bacterium]
MNTWRTANPSRETTSDARAPRGEPAIRRTIATARVARRGAIIASAVFAALAAVTVSLAAGEARAETTREPGVARVSLIEGEASYFRSDADDWSAVSVNAPLVTGDRFYSAEGSRAEIEAAPGVDVRLGAETEIDMVELAPDAAHVRVALGRATLRVRRDPGGRRIELDTPAAAFVAREAGVYRVEVDADGRTKVMVREGALEARDGDDTYRLGAGSGAVIAAGTNGHPDRFDVGAPDAWDEWESERARRIENATSYQYVSEDIYGGEDLDDHGEWQYRRGYGQIWRPYGVASDWAPYTTGRWVWCPPWGWTWMDYASWGWAPYHYGRWVWLDDYWAWAPGPVIASPVYAPALVGFYGAGFGGGFSWSVGFGVDPWIGWVPLGWGEPCIPWWGGWGGAFVGVPWWGGWGGPRVVNNVFINKQVNIYNIDTKRIRFANSTVPRGVTAVSRGSFANGRFERVPIGGDHGNLVPISGRIPISPDRASLQAANPARAQLGRVPTPPTEGAGRRAVAGGSLGGGGDRADGTGRRSIAAYPGREPVISSERGAAGRGNRGEPAARAPLAGAPGAPSGGADASGRTRAPGAIPRPPTTVGTQVDRSAIAPRDHTPYIAARPGFGGRATAPSGRSIQPSPWSGGTRSPWTGGARAPSGGGAPSGMTRSPWAGGGRAGGAPPAISVPRSAPSYGGRAAMPGGAPSYGPPGSARSGLGGGGVPSTGGGFSGRSAFGGSPGGGAGYGRFAAGGGVGAGGFGGRGFSGGSSGSSGSSAGGGMADGGARAGIGR